MKSMRGELCHRVSKPSLSVHRHDATSYHTALKQHCCTVSVAASTK
jgi:hypothetical protein